MSPSPTGRGGESTGDGGGRGASGPGDRRNAFQLPPGEHYLNCAYMSPLPRRTEEAIIEGVRKKRFPAVIGPEDFFEGSRRLRERFGRLVTADPDRVAILPSVSYGMAVCARNLGVGRGQSIVVAHEQFPGNVYPWRRLAADTGASITVVHPPEGDRRGAGWTERFVEAIDESTAVVTLGHVHWTDGTRFGLEAIGARAREVGAALLVDGTQSVGALPFSVAELEPDALICAGYKWLLGPYSLCLGYFGPRFDGGVPVEETWAGRRGSEDFKGLVEYVDEYQPGAVRYDVGERSNFALVPGLNASLSLLLEWTPEWIQDYCGALTEELFPAVRALGFHVEEAAWRSRHLFGIRLPDDLELQRLRAALSARKVHVSLRGSAVRVSPHVYNTADDVGALIEGLRAARG